MQPAPSEVRFAQVQGRFLGDPIPINAKYFDMILGDMDLDGDLDFLLNRHNLQRPELFENVGASFEQINRAGADLSGLYDNPGIPELYGERSSMVAAIDARGVPGIYVWHEPAIRGQWLLRIVPVPGASEHTLRLVTNRPMNAATGLSPSEWTRPSPFELELRVDATLGARSFELGNMGVNTQLIVSTDDPGAFGLFAGTEFKEFPSRVASLWKQDPHGMALVDGVGGPEPDLFLSGGGLAGNHLPPHAPQADRLLEYTGTPTRYSEVPANVIPADYGRGRQAMWVDFDADGANELYVSNRQTPNVLLERDSAGRFQDVAPENELDLVAPESYAWTDIDQDGHLDLVYLDGGAIGIAYRRGTTFEHGDGAGVGLELPSEGSRDASLFEEMTFHLFDVDRDGDLDIWFSRVSLEGVGSDGQIACFRNDGGTYVLRTDELGLGTAAGIAKVMLADVDNDGWLDLITGGAEFGWWRNLLGESFEFARLDGAFNSPVTEWFTAGDVNLDGRIDIVMMSSLARQLLPNRTEGPNTLLQVHPDLPLGSIIRAYHPDGTVFAQQWGSATVTRYSQSLQPLRFGQAPGVPVTELGVQWPGDPEERYRIEVPPGASTVGL